MVLVLRGKKHSKEQEYIKSCVTQLVHPVASVHYFFLRRRPEGGTNDLVACQLDAILAQCPIQPT